MSTWFKHWSQDDVSYSTEPKVVEVTKYKMPNGEEVSPQVWHKLKAFSEAMELLDAAGVPVQEDGRGLSLARRVELLIEQKQDVEAVLSAAKG